MTRAIQAPTLTKRPITAGISLQIPPQPSTFTAATEASQAGDSAQPWHRLTNRFAIGLSFENRFPHRRRNSLEVPLSQQTLLLRCHIRIRALVRALVRDPEIATEIASVVTKGQSLAVPLLVPHHSLINQAVRTAAAAAAINTFLARSLRPVHLSTHIRHTRHPSYHHLPKLQNRRLCIGQRRSDIRNGSGRRIYDTRLEEEKRWAEISSSVLNAWVFDAHVCISLLP